MTIQRVSSGIVQTNAAGQLPRKVSGQKQTTAPKQVGDKKEARGAEAPQVSQAPQALDPRLAAYARNVDTRLKVAIGNSAEAPREKAALEAAQKQFHSMVFRLDQAFMKSAKGKLEMAPGEGMNKVLGHLTGSVHTVLTHGSIDVKG